MLCDHKTFAWGVPDLKDKEMCETLKLRNATTESLNSGPLFEFKFFGWPILSFIPWVANVSDRFKMPSTVNRELKRRARTKSRVTNTSARPPPVKFRPYVSKVPWHTGVRGFMSQLFPRYGHYCGPNWSSGKDGGSGIWDMRPIDWLDYCCYCHDMGYDTHDQAKLLEADLSFLECLEKPHSDTKGDKYAAHIYKTMCVHGLRNILIPYRMQLVKIENGRSLIHQFEWLSNMMWERWDGRTRSNME